MTLYRYLVMMQISNPIVVYRVKVIEFDPTTEIEGYSYYDFDDSIMAYRFRELIYKSKNVIAVYLPQCITL